MNSQSTPRQVPTRFGRATRFNLTPRFSPVDTHVQTRFEQLKTRLLKPVLQETSDAVMRRQLRLAANEAAAVAWTTPYPLLMLPVLLEEKAAEVHQYAAHQEQVQYVSQVLVGAGP